MSIWDRLKVLVGGRKQTPDGYGPDVIVHHPQGEPDPVMAPEGAGTRGTAVTGGEATTGGEAVAGGEERPAATQIPPGARSVAGQNVDRYVALTIAQQAARAYCNMDAGLPTIYSTEFQRSTVDDGAGHLVPGWEVRIFFNCPGPPIA